MSGRKKDLAAIARTLGYEFTRESLLREALTHPSVPGGDPNYQRLEFLGDRVLGLVVANMLWRRYPDEDEGALSRRHVALVRSETLTGVAENIDLGRFLNLADSEDGAGASANPAILADACEAVIGALYIDGGLEAAAAFIEARWAPLLAAEVPPQDAKTELQEWAQGRGRPLPSYRTVARSGPDHAPVFSVEVRVEGAPPASADGSSKRAAEQAAAAQLLAALKARRKQGRG